MDSLPHVLVSRGPALCPPPAVWCIALLLASCGGEPPTASMGHPGVATDAMDEVGAAARCYKSARHPECGVEVEAAFEEVQHRAPCRLREFGLETWWIQNEMPYETAEHTMRGDQCNNFFNYWGPAHFYKEKYRECMDVMTDIAHANLGPDARVECITPAVSSCYHDGPRSTRFRYLYRVQILLPQWHLRHDPRCPQIGPSERRQTRAPVYAECRHELNGLADDPSECG